MKFEKVINDIKIAKGLVADDEKEFPIVEPIEDIQEGAPAQQSLTTRVFNKVRGSMGGLQSATTNKINAVYKNVWNEYAKSLKVLQGSGGQRQHTLNGMSNILQKMGANPKTIKATIQANYAGVNPNNSIGDDKAAAKFIYSVLQRTYQQNGYQPSYRLPTSL